MKNTAIIIGAGPAGLTAAYELLTRTDVIPIILEKSGEIGGISRTTNYKGNRMDMGPHRFFSKSDRVMEWWLKIMPLEEAEQKATTITYQNKSRNISATSDVPDDCNKRMLLIQRLTRIYFLRKFFAYPIQLSLKTLKNLGPIRTIRILLSFLWIKLFPRNPESSLEDFIVNRFGLQLYLLFFKDYTEKVWGIAPSQISAEWGAQRIKGVSLGKAISTAVKNIRGKNGGSIAQKDKETSLIEQFLYPKYGPGSLWEEVARQVQEMGGHLYLNQEVQQISSANGKIASINTLNAQTGETHKWAADFFFSTMPVQELIAGLGNAVPPKVREVAAGLQYRDFINVGILLSQLSDTAGHRLNLKDNWIYIQERDVKVGRLMIYNNWGGGMIKDPDTTWIGMEYFCNKTDELWSETDEAIQQLAIRELARMNLARPENVLDSTVCRMEKTYPAYFGTYNEFDRVRSYTDSFENLFLIGRNGMHKYNNTDHSMLTAMVAVDNIATGVISKANIWAINTEQEYHEEKTQSDPTTAKAPKKRPGEKYPFLVTYLWSNQPNRAWWIAGVIFFIIQFAVFKLRYPFANYMPDSYSYIEAASSNADVNMWPVAYSKFLRLISVFTHSDRIVVGSQYLFLQCASLLFLYSIIYFLRPGRGIKTFLLLFFLLDPLPLYMANYISADALFTGMSLLWFTTLVWTIFSPRPVLIAIHALLLLGCFVLRYNAIYYPFITIITFMLSKQNWKQKLAGISLCIALVSMSYLYTSHKMKDATGQWQFSAFGGWQLANNALYMYEHIPAAQRGPVPARFAALEIMIRHHIDTLNKVKLTHEDSVNGYFYLWSARGPLIQYLNRQYENDSTTSYFKRWASEAPLYRDYAMHLIRKFPVQFVENFVLVNTIKYAVPPAEFLGEYNMGADNVRKLAKDWFNYKSLKVQDHNQNKQDKIAATEWFPVFGAMANCLIILSIIGIMFVGAVRWKEYGLPQLLFLVAVLWLLNFVFSIFASPVVLRYQVFTLFMAFGVGTILIERIYKLAQQE